MNTSSDPGADQTEMESLFTWPRVGLAVPVDPMPRLTPLTARSVMLSVLLGSNQPVLPVYYLVRAAQLFGVSEGTARVALSRMTADGDLEAEAGRYRLSPRLLSRQGEQDNDVDPPTTGWSGRWDLVIAMPPAAGAGERAFLRTAMRRLRLAEVRPGVWARPDNLRRQWPAEVRQKIWKFYAEPDLPLSGQREVVGWLWDVDGWTGAARNLLAKMDAARLPADGFTVAAAMTRLMRLDPILPPELLPADWPGPELRRSYTTHLQQFAALLSSDELFRS